jgi:hypothetical protein
MRRTLVTLAALAPLVLSTGCAAVFRSSNPPVKIETDPPGADVESASSKSPTTIQASRSSTTNVSVKKDGYAPYYGAVKRSLNPGWAIWDIGTCVFPIALCIPLLIDAISSGWMDVEETHHVRLDPAAPGVALAAGAPSSAATAAATAAPSVQMSENDRKSAARAAFMEGAQLQEQNNCALALQRFRTAQKFVSAPTHLLRIGQCSTTIGKLVDAQEAYESLAHLDLGPNPPEAFTKAVERGRMELAALKPRIPQLRVQVQPAAASVPGLVVQINGATIPNELIDLPRPTDPGAYKITATAPGYREAKQELKLAEGAQRTVVLELSK